MLKTFFDVTPQELGQLDPDLAVDVLRQMIWAEASYLGIPVSDTDVPFSIDVADGGVDAYVKAEPKHPGTGLIFPPRTYYQVKAGKFSLGASTKGSIEKLLIRPASIDARQRAGKPLASSSYTTEDISPRVKACFESDGTFITMLFGDDNPDREEEATEKAIRNFISGIEPRYSGAKIRVWRQSKICALLRNFPGVSLLIKNLPDFSLLAHDQWAQRLDVQQDFVPAGKQTELIDSLRAALRDQTPGFIHVRLLGEPGIGKTRLVFETLRPDDLKPLVLYADRETKLDTPTITALLRAEHAQILLVVDECGPDLRSELTRTFGGRGTKLKIITIYQDEEDGDRASVYRLVAAPSLPDSAIEAILATYGVDAAVQSRWARLCEGSPRVAHVLGQNLRDNPEDPFRSDGISQIWVRFLASDVSQNSDEYRRRHLVLATLSLFKRFGWGDPVRNEAYAIFDLVLARLDSNLSKVQFSTIVEQMIARKVLQGGNFLYITPRALHIKLWIDWWKQYRHAVDVNKLVPLLSRRARGWFGEMFEYAGNEPITAKVVADLFGPEGPYADAEWLKTDEGARFFFSLSIADPNRALRVLQRTIGQMDHEALREFRQGRRDVVRTLEFIALYGELFRPAANLLMLLAEAENERWTNNATGVFSGLFSLGPGEVAPTSLPPEDRLPVLTSALSNNETRAELALKAFDVSFEIRTITRWGGEEPFRLGDRVQRWSPTSYEEWYAAYRLYWKSLSAALDRLQPRLRQRGGAILLSHARELLSVEALQNDVLTTLNYLASSPDMDTRDVLETIDTILEFDSEGLPAQVVAKLSSQREALIGTTYESRLRRYVGMALLTDELDENTREESSRVRRELHLLAKESVQNPEEFRSQLSWLVTKEAKNGYQFGHLIGELDPERLLWPCIIAAWQSAGTLADDFFLGGYLRSVFERSIDEWESIICQIVANDQNLDHTPGLVWRSGISEDIARLLINLVKSGRARPETLGVFSLGRAAEGIPEQVFREWLEVFLSLGTWQSVSTALNLASMSLYSQRKLDAPLITKLLTHPALFHREEERSNVMLAHHWLRLAKTLNRIEVSSEVLLLRLLIETLGNRDAITGSLGPEGEKYLDELASKHPAETWRIASRLIKQPMDVRGFAISRWLRGDMGFGKRNPGPLRYVPREEVWDWIEKDRETRAAYVANMAPKDFTPDTWNNSLVRELLCRFGNDEKVRSAVFSNFFTGGWMGPASSHYAAQREALSALKLSETDPNALRWIRDVLEALEREIESAELEEEARGF